jgi:hypothetical protein
MGCNCSRENKTIMSSFMTKDENLFTVKINYPYSQKVKLVKHFEKNDYILLSELLNHIFFCSNEASELDANFMSFYDEKNEKFHYFIERMVGHGIENESPAHSNKAWVTYINKEKNDWNILCSKNRIIKRGDEIEFFFENIK